MAVMHDALVLTDLSGGDCDLRFEGVAKRYDDFTLEGVTFGVPRGSVVGLLGRNGAGKTTLMKAAFGIVGLDAGHVEVFGVDGASLAEDEFIALRQRIGFVGAVMAFPVGMTIEDVARLYERAYPRFDQALFNELCARLDLHASGKTIKDLSRGMGMKLQLACVLASGAELLVLDEPTAGLDPIVRDDVLVVLRSWVGTADRSILISSHITSDLERLADYLVMVEDGRIALMCTTAQVGDMGVVRLRADELDRLLADPSLPYGQMRVLRRDWWTSLLVASRADMQRAHPELSCNSVSIDDLMTIVVKGEVR